MAPSGNGRTEVAYTLDSRVVADLGGTRILDEGDARSQQPRKPRPRGRRRLVIGLVVAAVLWAGHSYGVPYVREMLETVETDDAFVAGHITYVSPRIEDVVTEVLVDQNDRVEPGELLVRLDREPFEVAVAQAEASLEEARANLVQARAQVRSQIARGAGGLLPPQERAGDAAPAGRDSERPGRHPQEQAVEPGAGAGRPAGGSRTSPSGGQHPRQSSTSGTTR